jgi:hypothetical protein
MHFLFCLLRIKGLYTFRALLDPPQEALKTALGILLACYVSWLHQDWSGTAVCVASPEDEQVILEICRGHQFLLNSVILVFYFLLNI